MANGFLTGIEVEKKYDCRNLIVRNRSGRAVDFTPPGKDYSVAVSHGRGIICWMDAAFERTEQWQLFELKRR